MEKENTNTREPIFKFTKNLLTEKSIAQGTIEYLVVIAVIVVISLIVVALVINVSSSPSQQISSSSDKLGNVAVGGISIVEAVSDLDGDSLIMLSNNSSEGITLKKITIGENDNNYDDYISGVDSVPISLTGLASSCPCESGQKSVKCEFVFEYLTKSGLTKIERRTINVQCTNSNEDPTPSNPNRVIEPIVPVLELGTLENPWIINDCLELQDMNQHLDGNYILGEDIDCSDTINWNFNNTINKNLGFEPIGKGGEYNFTGDFNGMGYTISGLYMYRPYGNEPSSSYNDFGDYAGMFGRVLNANISSVNLIDANIMGDVIVGGIISFMENSVLSNSSYQGEIRGKTYVGGLVGWTSGMGYYITGGNENKIINSYNSSSVISLLATEVGGIVGFNNYGTILNSYNKGTIFGNSASQVGGLVGVNNNGTVNNSYNIGEVNGTGENVGGLFGKNLSYSFGSASYLFNAGSVNGTGNYVGGLVGYADNDNYISNGYWDTSLTNKNNCYCLLGPVDSNKGCTSTSNDVFAYYGANGVVKLNNDGNWVATDTYPILSWQ